jgi:FdrA protein
VTVGHLDVRRGVYHDSVGLMQVSRTVGGLDGVEAALIAMATELNLGFLEPMGFHPDALDAGPDDLLVAIRARDEQALAAALTTLEAALAGPTGGRGRGWGPAPPPRTTAAALAEVGGADLVLISTPGEHAFVEALDALRGGANVMIFSDNVPVDAEVPLKREAGERGLLVMGPDCGTAILGGVGLGFANVVRPGPVGVVAATGTGAQQLTCLLDDAAVGVSHVVGVGGRDLTADVGAASTLHALQALDADPATELIVVLSKPPAETVAARVREAAAGCATPTVLGLIGPDGDDLTGVARTVLDRLGVDAPEPAAWPPLRRGEAGDARPGLLRGLFAGGTLCTEAMVIASRRLGPIRSNVPLEPGWGLDRPGSGDGHVMLDLGEDRYTRGRPHPMIDQQPRIERLQAEADDERVGVVLLDVVLGHGAHPDPAGELAPAIRAVRKTAADGGRELAVVASVCGTASDPQGRDRQVATLRESGASVHLSNAAAARQAVRLAGGGR